MTSLPAAPFAAPVRRDGLTPAQLRLVAGGVIALHLLGGWALLQVPEVRQVVAEAAPMFVDLVAPPAPPIPAPSPPPAPVAKLPPPRQPVRSPPPIVTAAPTPAPAAFVAPPAPPEPAVAEAPPADPAPAPAVIAPAPAPVSPPAPPAPPPAPREIPAAAIQYLEPPAPVYPRLSRRQREAGLVVVRVLVDVDGMPRQLQVLQSSGFPRLDEAALAGVQKARFRPYSEGGRPVSGWARIPIPFELEN